MQESPRVGLILMRADWLGCAEIGDIRAEIESDTQEMLTRLRKHFDVLEPWVVDTPDALRACQQGIDAERPNLDMILLAFQTWADDSAIINLLKAVSTLPLVLWCYLPWRRMPRPARFNQVLRGSGPVGAFGTLGTLRNLDVPFLFTFGAPDDPRLIDDLTVAAHAALARKALRRARFGLIPSGQHQMQVTFVDEARLREDFGVQVESIPVSDYRRAADALPAEQVQAYVQRITAQFSIGDDAVTPRMLEQAARASLGLAALAAERRLDVVAVNDGESALNQVFDLRPSLYPPEVEGAGSAVLYQPEADLGAATANFVLSRLTGSPTLFLEMLFWDEAKNQVVGGHWGLQNPGIAESGRVSIGRDPDFCRQEISQGVQMQMIARPGRVTLFQLRHTPRGWHAIAMTGVALEGLPWVEGYPHAILRLDTPVQHFLNHVATVGVSPHWVMAYGSVLHELEAFCQMEKIDLDVLTY